MARRQKAERGNNKEHGGAWLGKAWLGNGKEHGACRQKAERGNGKERGPAGQGLARRGCGKARNKARVGKRLNAVTTTKGAKEMAALTRRETGGALAPIQQLKSMLGSTGYQAKISETMGSKESVQEFCETLMSIVSDSDQLQKCRPETVIKAALDAVRTFPKQGSFVLTPAVGMAYVVPYGQEAQFVLGWKGRLQLVQRSGQVKRMNKGVVKEGQFVGYDSFREPIFDWSKNGKETIGYFSCMELNNGFQKTVYMTVQEIIEHAKKFSSAYQYDLKSGKASSPWSKHFDAMAEKTLMVKMMQWAPLLLLHIKAEAPTAVEEEDYIETTMQDVSETETEAAEPQKASNETSGNDDDDILNFEVE